MTAYPQGNGLFARSGAEVSRIGVILRRETVGGVLLLAAAAARPALGQHPAR